MRFKKPSGLEIVKIALWAAMFALFAAYVVLRQTWMTLAIDIVIVVYGVIVVADPGEKRGEKMIIGFIALTRIVDIVMQIKDGMA